jgi:hypothetical protein
MSQWPTWVKWTLGVIVGLIVIGAIFGQDDKKDKNSSAQTTTQAEAATTEEVAQQESPPVEVDVSSPDSGATLRKPRVVVRGTVTPGAHVDLNGHSVASHGGRWRKTVKLDLGDNELNIAATKDGYEDGSYTLTVTRERSAAELAAIRRKRAEARAAAEANFKAQAQTIAYNQLKKDADRYAGTKVKFTGQIFQIQEDQYLGGIMLLSVTNEGYGLWDDNVWINYDHPIKSAEEDVVTVYGVIKGAKSYETQIGGETYVPEVDARYIDE